MNRRTEGSPGSQDASDPGALAGVTVLDFTQVLSGPTCTRYLAEMGAAVIKVEAPGGEITRQSLFRRNGRSGYFVNVNRGKQSVCVDLKDERGLDVVRRMATSVDVVVENFSPGTMDRLGLGWNELSSANAGLIMASISGFGQTGPLARLPGYDGAAQAYAGLTGLNGEADGPPVAFGAPVGDVLTGMNALSGILAALFWRDRSGRGQHVRTSVLESYLQAHDTALQSYAVSGGSVEQQRNGRFHPLVCPYGIFAAVDGYVFIAAAADNHWVDLCRAMARPDLAQPDHPWSGRPDREADRHEINALIDQWLSGLASRDEAVRQLQAHRVPCGPVLSVDEVMNHPGLIESGVITTVDDPVLGDLRLPAFPLHFSETPTGTAAPAPHLGEHNDLLREAAGGAESYADLVAKGVIQQGE